MTAALAAAVALASGLLLGAAQPGFDLSALAWVGLVPLLLVMRGASVRRAFMLGWLAGAAYYALVLYWIVPTISTYTSVPAPLAVVLELLAAMVAGSLFGLFAAGVEWLAEAGISRVVSVPALWIVIEWLRTFFPAAFPWAFLGYSQVAFPTLVQVADIAGVYGLSALLAFANAAAAEIFRDGVRRHAALTGLLATLVTFTVAYGVIRIRTLDALKGRTVRVGLIQPNIAQDEKWRPGLEDSIVARQVVLTATAIGQGAEIVVWPEASIPFYLALDERSERLRDIARRARVDLLVGAPGAEPGPDGEIRPFNQAWLIRRDGELVGPYDKIRLVPFGEYVPWGGLFGVVQRIVEGVGDFVAGSSYVVFDAQPGADGTPVKASVLICYEAIFPDLTRRFVNAGANLLVNISNDAWYGDTAAPRQLLAMIALRAVENRVPLVRSTNTGISAFVSATGVVSDATALFEQAAVTADVELVRGFSLYTLLGDWLVYLALALVVVLAVIRKRSGPLLIRATSHGILTA